MLPSTQNKFRIALGYFSLLATLGLALRFFPLGNLNINYKFWVHTHSHIALLGWVYLGLTALIMHFFVPRTDHKKSWGYLYWFTQLTLVGMLLSFPFQGYALFSIIFSTLFLFASYIFTYKVLKAIPEHIKNGPAYIWIKTALWFLVLSSIGPWALGYIMKTLGPTSIWYRNAIYFYLHFLYNGFFFAALFGLITQKVTKSNPQGYHTSNLKRAHNTFLVGTVLSLVLSFLWCFNFWWLRWIGITGLILLVISLWQLTISLKRDKKVSINTLKTVRRWILILIIIYVLKLVFQGLGALPISSIYSNQSLIIGYLHFVFLGPISMGLLFLAFQENLIILPKLYIWVYLLGFLGTETLLFLNGGAMLFPLEIPAKYDVYLFSASVLLWIGITGVAISNASHIKPKRL